MTARPPGAAKMIWIAIGMIAVEMIGVGGIVLALAGGGGYAAAQIAVCAALIIVPILFGIAIRSELKARKKQ